MKRGDQADWRSVLHGMRTLAALRTETPGEITAERLNDHILLQAAAENPDHSEAGRRFAAEALQKLGASGHWRLSVPGFITAKDLERGPRLFFGFGRAVRKWSGIAFYLVFVLLLLIAAWLAVEVEQLRSDAASHAVAWIEVETPADAKAWGDFGRVRPHSDWLFAIDDVIGSSIALLILPPLLVWFFATAFRGKPARVVLLRKFNRRELAVPLERMMAHELRPYGHVVSLSDKHIRRDMFGWVSTAILSLSNPLAAAWFVIGAPIRFVVRLFDRSSMGPAVVLNARDYRNLAKRLRDRIGLNLQMAFTSKEAVLVRTNDAWWRLVARLLIDSADVIVMDLSDIGAGSEWELDRLKADAVGARCVFVALWGKAEAAERALRARGFVNSLFAYAPDGEMQQRAAFRVAMLDAMKAARA